MATTLEQLAEQAMALPSESRAQLADLLVESLEGDELGESSNCGSAKRNVGEMKFVQGWLRWFQVKKPCEAYATRLKDEV